ncbi:MAG: hypothetical protein ACR5K7_00155 [Symbiopectobacterium sp.]
MISRNLIGSNVFNLVIVLGVSGTAVTRPVNLLAFQCDYSVVLVLESEPAIDAALSAQKRSITLSHCYCV